MSKRISNNEKRLIEQQLEQDRLLFGRSVYRAMNDKGWSTDVFAGQLNEALAKLDIPTTTTSEVEGWVFGESVPSPKMYKVVEKTLLKDLPISEEEREEKARSLREAYDVSEKAIANGAPATSPERLAFGRMLLQLRQAHELGFSPDEKLADKLNKAPSILRDEGIPVEGFTVTDVENIIYGLHPLTPSVVSLVTRVLGDESGKLHGIYQNIQKQELTLGAPQAPALLRSEIAQKYFPSKTPTDLSRIIHNDIQTGAGEEVAFNTVKRITGILLGNQLATNYPTTEKKFNLYVNALADQLPEDQRNEFRLDMEASRATVLKKAEDIRTKHYAEFKRSYNR